MRIDEVTGRAVHTNGRLRIDRRKETDPIWEYQHLVLMDPDDGPEWVPVLASDTTNWPKDGWNSVDDWA